LVSQVGLLVPAAAAAVSLYSLDHMGVKGGTNSFRSHPQPVIIAIASQSHDVTATHSLLVQRL